MSSLSISASRGSRNIFPTTINCMFYSTTKHFDRLCPNAKPLARLLLDIDTIVLKHLKKKTDWVSDNNKDENWIADDLTVLSRIQDTMKHNENFSQIKEPFLGIVNGLIVHARYRTDIIINNKTSRPENGALIRRFYNYADTTLILSSIDVLKEHKIIAPIESDGLFTEAYLSAELRRIIRNVSRVAGSVLLANMSAKTSLIDAACVFPNEVLEQFHAYTLAKKICDFYLAGQNEDAKNLREDLDVVFTKHFPLYFLPRDKISKELIAWVESNSFGLTFDNLQKKYSNQNKPEEDVLKTIINKSTQPNQQINDKWSGKKTEVTERYIKALQNEAPSLYAVLNPKGSEKRYNLANVMKRTFYSRSSSRSTLEDILENKILKEPVVWQKYGFLGLTVNMGNGITADLFPGLEDHNTTIRVTDGEQTVRLEISEYWLDNWSVAQEQISSPDSKS